MQRMAELLSVSAVHKSFKYSILCPAVLVNKIYYPIFAPWILLIHILKVHSSSAFLSSNYNNKKMFLQKFSLKINQLFLLDL